MGERVVTIKEVAADAGVSVGTVSKVLRNVYVKEGNRKKVEASIAKLNYQVNTYARGLRTDHTDTVAIIVPDLINPFFSMLVNYVEQVVAALGYRLLVCNSHNNEDRELAYINMVKQNKVDGLIALTYSNADEYIDMRLPLVSIDRHFKHLKCCVSSDNAQGGRLAAEKFIATGCRKVLFIRNGSSLEGETLKRGIYFISTCRNADIEATSVDLGEETTLYKEQIERLEHFLKMNMEDGRFDFDGIFTSSDVHAMIAVDFLRSQGIRVPEDVQVIGYDGTKMLNIGKYVVSSIEQPVKEMALACVENLIKLIRQEPVDREIVLPVRFVDGGTTQ